MKKNILLSLLVFVALTLSAQERRELHILSINDPHAAIEQFPRLGFVADSLRTLYPDLLVLSAGDNRSGDPINDMFEIPAYPMVALMNQVGFHATVVGNHEFDSNQDGLARLKVSVASRPFVPTWSPTRSGRCASSHIRYSTVVVSSLVFLASQLLALWARPRVILPV